MLDALNGNGSFNSLNNNQRINNMLITDCYSIGVEFFNANNSEVTNSRISFIAGNAQALVSAALYFTSSNGNISGNGLCARDNTITSITSANHSFDAYGIYGGSDVVVTGNRISSVTAVSPGIGYGVFGGSFAESNFISNCSVGIFGAAKYANNLTRGCATPFNGGGIATGFND